jgi:hypothetical protein
LRSSLYFMSSLLTCTFHAILGILLISSFSISGPAREGVEDQLICHSLTHSLTISPQSLLPHYLTHYLTALGARYLTASLPHHCLTTASLTHSLTCGIRIVNSEGVRQFLNKWVKQKGREKEVNSKQKKHA